MEVQRSEDEYKTSNQEIPRVLQRGNDKGIHLQAGFMGVVSDVEVGRQ